MHPNYVSSRRFTFQREYSSGGILPQMKGVSKLKMGFQGGFKFHGKQIINFIVNKR